MKQVTPLVQQLGKQLPREYRDHHSRSNIFSPCLPAVSYRATFLLFVARLNAGLTSITEQCSDTRIPSSPNHSIAQSALQDKDCGSPRASLPSRSLTEGCTSSVAFLFALIPLCFSRAVPCSISTLTHTHEHLDRRMHSICAIFPKQCVRQEAEKLPEEFTKLLHLTHFCRNSFFVFHP